MWPKILLTLDTDQPLVALQNISDVETPDEQKHHQVVHPNNH
jgi:hypothetical protein